MYKSACLGAAGAPLGRLEHHLSRVSSNRESPSSGHPRFAEASRTASSPILESGREPRILHVCLATATSRQTAGRQYRLQQPDFHATVAVPQRPKSARVCRIAAWLSPVRSRLPQPYLTSLLVRLARVSRGGFVGGWSAKDSQPRPFKVCAACSTVFRSFRLAKRLSNSDPTISVESSEGLQGFQEGVRHLLPTRANAPPDRRVPLLHSTGASSRLERTGIVAVARRQTHISGFVPTPESTSS